MAGVKKERKFVSYNALYKSLGAAGVSKSGATATLLLELFLEDGGRLQASKVVSRGICEEGHFSEWRDGMVKAGWLVWSHTQADRGLYFAGKRLASYLNREKLKTQEIATKQDLAGKADRDEVQELRAMLNEHEERLAKIEDVSRRLQQAIEPPDTPEKSALRKECASALSKLTAKNVQ